MITFEENIAIENERLSTSDYEEKEHHKHKHLKKLFRRIQKHKYKNPSQKKTSEIETKISNELSVIFKVYIFYYYIIL